MVDLTLVPNPDTIRVLPPKKKKSPTFTKIPSTPPASYSPPSTTSTPKNLILRLQLPKTPPSIPPSLPTAPTGPTSAQYPINSAAAPKSQTATLHARNPSLDVCQQSCGVEDGGESVQGDERHDFERGSGGFGAGVLCDDEPRAWCEFAEGLGEGEGAEVAIS
ncbi:hypothetical protein K432DRAFT_466807 [Lepidopterella palustris CBS 459.81]|uniref:Uncharacterized protein n=1 Tax=Lepidopterella palustris CBS 459.81 TaxID=1314670 RepID=A0A8E2E0V6_9PEZI|nr:hypothetical protein K432DRAFT_466807 [Lepidopterella palustris CBS 459.81]